MKLEPANWRIIWASRSSLAVNFHIMSSRRLKTGGNPSKAAKHQEHRICDMDIHENESDLWKLEFEFVTRKQSIFSVFYTTLEQPDSLSDFEHTHWILYSFCPRAHSPLIVRTYGSFSSAMLLSFRVIVLWFNWKLATVKSHLPAISLEADQLSATHNYWYIKHQYLIKNKNQIIVVLAKSILDVIIIQSSFYTHPDFINSRQSTGGLSCDFSGLWGIIQLGVVVTYTSLLFATIALRYGTSPFVLLNRRETRWKIIRIILCCVGVILSSKINGIWSFFVIQR